MTEIEKIIEDLRSTESRTVRRAVKRTADCLRSGGLTKREIGSVGEELVRLSKPPATWEVRKAVAHAAKELRHDTFDVIMASLTRPGEHDFVREAAERTLRARTKKRQLDHLSEEHRAILDELLSEIGNRFGEESRKLAEKVALNYAELFVDEAFHEITRVLHPLESSLAKLEKDLAQKRFDRAAADGHLSAARDQVKFLGSLSKSILSLSENVKLDFRVHEVRKLASEAVAIVRDGGKAQGNRIQVEVDVDRGLRVEADHTRLLQALCNVIENAYEALARSEPPRRLWIEACADGEDVAISVRDGGPGMSETACREAFERGTTTKPNGTGYGLPFSRRVVEWEHGGTIELESAVGSGTTVTMRIPRERPSK